MKQSEKTAAGKAEVLKQLQDAVDSVTAAKVTVEKMKLSEMPQLVTAATDFDKLLKEAKVSAPKMLVLNAHVAYYN